MLTRVLSCGVLLCLLAPAWGADAVAPPGPTNADLLKAITDMKATMVTKDDLANFATRQELADTAKAVRQEVAANKAAADDVATRVGKLEKDAEEMRQWVFNQGYEMENLAHQNFDRASGGQWTPRVRSWMQNDNARAAVVSAVEQALPRSGVIRVRNNMQSGQSIDVNGASYYVGPYGTIDVTVPVGAATTWLRGYESPKSWTLGTANNYLQTVDINPRYATYYLPTYYPDYYYGWPL